MNTLERIQDTTVLPEGSQQQAPVAISSARSHIRRLAAALMLSLAACQANPEVSTDGINVKGPIATLDPMPKSGGGSEPPDDLPEVGPEPKKPPVEVKLAPKPPFNRIKDERGRITDYYEHYKHSADGAKVSSDDAKEISNKADAVVKNHKNPLNHEEYKAAVRRLTSITAIAKPMAKRGQIIEARMMMECFLSSEKQDEVQKKYAEALKNFRTFKRAVIQSALPRVKSIKEDNYYKGIKAMKKVLDVIFLQMHLKGLSLSKKSVEALDTFAKPGPDYNKYPLDCDPSSQLLIQIVRELDVIMQRRFKIALDSEDLNLALVSRHALVVLDDPDDEKGALMADANQRSGYLHWDTEEEYRKRARMFEKTSFKRVDGEALIATSYLEMAAKIKDDDARLMALLNKGLEVCPGELNLLLARGQTLIRLKQYKNAEADIKQAIEINPSDARLLVLLGYLHLQIGRAKEAETIFKQALRVDPDEHYALLNLGRIYRDAGDNIKAIEHYKRASNKKGAEGWAHLQMGNIYKEAGLFFEAGWSFDHALRVARRKKNKNIEATALSERAQLHLDSKLYRKAKHDLDQAIELKPNESLYWYQRGVVYLASEKYRKAMADLKKCIELYAPSQKAREKLIEIYERFGYTEEAEKCRKELAELKKKQSD